MKRLLFILILILIHTITIGQVYQSMPQYGYGPVKRMDFDSSLTIPTTCGVPTLRTYLTKKAALAYDSCNKRLYYYDPKLLAWDTIKGGAGSSFDSTSLSNRINLKLSISDTGSMLNHYLRKIDTASLSNRINLKLSISDTAGMLLPYLRKVDTANKWVNYIYRTPGKDSIFYRIDNITYGIKDSVGGGGGQNGRFGNDTATVIMAKVHNDAGVQLTKGKVVYLSPSGSSSDVPSVKLASNKADSCSANTFGFVTGTIAINDTGWIVIGGKIEKINTSAFTNGDILYLDSIAGNFTKTKPQAPYHIVYLGAVIKANAGNGAIEVKIQNGWELTELHDVQINGKLNNQILVYSDTQKVWKNRNVYTVVDTTKLSARIDQRVKYSDTANLLAPYVHYTDTANMLSPYLKKADSTIYQTKYRTDTMRTNIYNAIKGPAGNNGDIQFKDGSGFGANGYLHWDNDEYRLGIGNDVPQNPLDVCNWNEGMNRGLYEAASFTTSGDTKVGIYSNDEDGNGGASLIFGQTYVTNENGKYVGFEQQFFPNYEDFNSNVLQFNSLERNANGSVASAGIGLMKIYANGLVSIDPVGINVSTNPRLEVYGTGYYSNTLQTTGQRLGYYSTNVNYTATENDHFILASSDDGDITITLPQADQGQTYIIKKSNDGGTITIAAQSGYYIDGASTYDLDAQYKYIQIIADNTGNWWIIGAN